MNDTMEPLNFVKEKFELAHLNTRREKHGDEPEIGNDLKLSGRMPNAVLEKFSPQLRPAFYIGDANRPALPGVDSMPNRINPEVASVVFVRKMESVKLTIHDAEFPERTAVLVDGKIKQFHFEMLDGGTVIVTFTVSFSAPDEDEIAKVRRVLFQTVPVSLEILAPEPKVDNFQQAELLGQEPKSQAVLEAEKHFNPAGAQSPEALVGLTPEPPPGSGEDAEADADADAEESQ